ncbi:MAG: AmmeMemoRadiSam system protein B [Nanobdellota archaeon]
MKKKRKTSLKILILFIIIFVILIGTVLIIQKDNIKEEDIRKANFAGSFYPANKENLQDTVQAYLDNTSKINFEGEIKAIIVPHAGYEYSGRIAATAFKQLDEEKIYKNIFLIGPSHRYYIKNVSVSGFEYFSTPLGEVKVSKKAKEMDENEEIISNIEDAHKDEHALEVELPFLQTQLKNSDFEIIPLIVGESNPVELKNILINNLEEEDLIVVSADLSHYHEDNLALVYDANTLKNILNLDSAGIFNSEIDAPWGVASLLEIAKEKSWKPYLLAYANSGDITGDKKSVVGYGAVVFIDESSFNGEEKEFLLNLARESAEYYLEKEKKMDINEKEVPEKLKEKKACFVTFIENGQLRGCIGEILPVRPLYECVMENAINAAIKDTRFSRVEYEEMKNITIDVSVLTVPVLLEYNNSEDLLLKLKPLEHGVILKRGLKQSTFLPSVWEFLPDKETFLANLCIKAEMEGECWTYKDTQVYVYTAEDFSE